MWRLAPWLNFSDETAIWVNSLDSKQMDALFDEDFEKVLLDQWSHAGKKDNKKQKYLYIRIIGSWMYSETEDHCVYQS